MKRLCLALALLSLWLGLNALAEGEDPVVVRVGDVAYAKSLVQFAYTSSLDVVSAYEDAVSDEDREALRDNAVERMFGLLTHYQKLDFLRKHPLVTLTTLWEKETYAVFAVLRVSTRPGDPDYFNDISPIASRADDTLSQLRSRSLHTIPVDVRPTDALLALSTCLDDDRLVVVARKRRADEPTDALVSAVEGAYEGQGGIG